MNTLFHTTLFTTFVLILVPILNPKSAHYTKTATKLACLTSLIPTLMFINSGLKSTTMNFIWVSTDFNIQVSLLFDHHTIIFLPTALFITWAILEFTLWYMASDTNLNKFTTYLLAFLLTMLVLTSANNMLQLFVGWEGVGVMSFLLIGWWHARANANAAALQAIIYNRIGDMGLIMTMAWLAMHFNTWELQQLLSKTPPTLPLLGLILAAMGKSAQFGLHPWLPSAMEGPTPVSALLHSSTMVIAGIFLLIRLHPLLLPNPLAATTCLCLGAMTTTFTALCALTQNDIKKIIAFSTSSQLGLMMLTLGLNQPNLAFLHIITHAFFKAMLFLCAGSIIHALHDEQDIRKMGGMQQSMPITTASLTIGNLALTGTPFLAGFYTKDTILETLNTSHLNAWALTTTLLATMLTAAYSLRLTYYVQLLYPRHPAPTSPEEANSHQTRPILRLAGGSIFMGLLATSTLLPLTPLPQTMPTTIKLSALSVTFFGALCAFDLTSKTTTLTPSQPNPLHTTLTQLNFFNTLMHRTQPQHNMQFTQTTALHLNDLLWYEAIAPKMLKTTSTLITNKLTTTQAGAIKTYLTMFVLLTTTCTALSML